MTLTKISTFLRKYCIDNFGLKEDASDQDVRHMIAVKYADEVITKEEIQRLQAMKDKEESTATDSTSPNPRRVLVNVKAHSERYSTTKSIAKHPRLGRPVQDEFGRDAMTTSEQEHAKMGVFLKWHAFRSGVSGVLTEHERSMWNEMLDRDRWVGQEGNTWKPDVSNQYVKALVSDSTSGGVNVNPEWFDTDLIQFLLLGGELLPLVDMKPVPRGAAVEGASIGNPTLSWNVSEPTEIPLFDTDGLIAAVNTSIFTVTASIEVGKDFLADAAADVGRALEENIGQRLAAELDKVIAIGDGVTQPEGIMTASGLTAVNSSNGGTGPWTVDDVEGVLFGINKAYRKDPNCAFISNDTTYQRIRSVPVDSSTDARRIFGMTHEDYTLLNRPHKIQNDVDNTDLVFGNCKKFRLYRRQGFTIEWHTQGKELARRNAALLVVRGRFGGRVVDSNGFAKIDDGQS
jgi:HK97 family phage major capsid protein